MEEDRALTALEAAAPEALPTCDMVARFGRETIDDLVVRDWLQEPTQLCKEYLLHSGEIEVTAHCNWGCAYCPVSRDPKPRKTMPLPLFTEIVEKLAAVDTVYYVTFHFFNEPTLDRHFNARVKILRDHGLKLSLYTNASALTADKLENLTESGVLLNLIVNVPSLDREDFSNLTGASTYTQSFTNLERAIATEAFPVELSVNGTGPERDRSVEELRALYQSRGVEVNRWLTCDRAGLLDGIYSQDVRIDGRLSGCSWPVNHAYFSVRGDLFSCCNDYYQREIYGHVSDGDLDEVMVNPRAVQLRRRVFGVETAPDDFICRSCHDQLLDFPDRQFRPLASFPLQPTSNGRAGGCRV